MPSQNPNHTQNIWLKREEQCVIIWTLDFLNGRAIAVDPSEPHVYRRNGRESWGYKELRAELPGRP